MTEAAEPRCEACGDALQAHTTAEMQAHEKARTQLRDVDTYPIEAWSPASGQPYLLSHTVSLSRPYTTPEFSPSGGEPPPQQKEQTVTSTPIAPVETGEDEDVEGTTADETGDDEE